MTDEVLKSFVINKVNEMKKMALVIGDGGGSQDDIIDAVEIIMGDADDIIEEIQK